MISTELLNSVRTSVKHEGLRSMYIGLVPTLIRDVPFSSKSDKYKLKAYHVFLKFLDYLKIKKRNV